jgi:hypothetical protein
MIKKEKTYQKLETRRVWTPLELAMAMECGGLSGVGVDDVRILRCRLLLGHKQLEEELERQNVFNEKL